MAGISVDEIQSRIAAIVDQDQDTTNISSDDYALRLNYINRALHTWGDTFEWQTLYKEYNMNVSTSTGNASVVLPSNFRKLASFPKITYDGSTSADFPEVLPQEDSIYASSQKRVWILGNPLNGYVLRVWGVSLVSGASVRVPYYSSPQSVASPANIPEIPNPEYLVQSTVAQIWESREDARYPRAKVDADRILANMIEFESLANHASDYGRVKTIEEKLSFRIGRD